jgi:hypothetical protein
MLLSTDSWNRSAERSGGGPGCRRAALRPTKGDRHLCGRQDAHRKHGEADDPRRLHQSALSRSVRARRAARAAANLLRTHSLSTGIPARRAHRFLSPTRYANMLVVARHREVFISNRALPALACAIRSRSGGCRRSAGRGRHHHNGSASPRQPAPTAQQRLPQGEDTGSEPLLTTDSGKMGQDRWLSPRVIQLEQEPHLEGSVTGAWA